MEAIAEAAERHGIANPYAERFKDWERDPDHEARLTTRVECAEYFHVRDEALLAHATQIDPDGWWFAIPREVQAEAWPTEDYQLVTSHVETTVPEDDLFAGLR
jgi:mycothiol S-conjugate amidase